MITAPRNTMVSAPRWRSGEIGPHVHDPVIVGTDGRGETYLVCSICDARSNSPHPRRDALLQDWLEYRVDWGAAEPAPAPEPAPVVAVAEEEDFDTDEPVRRGPGRPRKYT